MDSASEKGRVTKSARSEIGGRAPYRRPRACLKTPDRCIRGCKKGSAYTWCGS